MQEPIVILGGGPAGAAAALELLRQGRAVVLLERSNYEELRVGETLPPSAHPLLVELGLLDPFIEQGHLESQGICSAWNSDVLHEKNFLFNPYGHGWHLDRQRFDQWLGSCVARAGGVLYQKVRLLDCEYDQINAWTLSLTLEDGQSKILRASFIIDATGRKCWLGDRLQAPRTTYDRLAGLAILFKSTVPVLEHKPVALVEAAEQGWWYSAPLPNRQLIVVYMTDVDLWRCESLPASARWTKRLEETCHTQRRVAGLTRHGGLHCFMADTYALDVSPNKRWVPAGAALLGIDPLSSEGICFALRSGRDAAHALVDDSASGSSPIQSYLHEQASFFAQYLRERQQYYAGETRWPQSEFWQRRRNTRTITNYRANRKMGQV